MFHTIVSIKNDGHYFCRAGGNRPDGLNEPVTEDEGDTECLTLYVLQIPVQNRWGMIQMAMKLWPLIFM
ncbi:hypothetical protein DMK68_22330 [Salmonella enterica]|nr:hypothetical protein [Salmonella enterica]